MAHPEIEELLAQLPSVAPEDLPPFELRVRSQWHYAPREPSVRDGMDVHMLGLISFHPNGYRREEALEQLALLDGDDAFRYLILRMNDWVPEVRERARRAVLDRLRPEMIGDHFYLLSRPARADKPLRQLLARMAGEAYQTMLDSAARMGGETAREIFWFLIESVPEALQAAIEAGAANGDAVIRTRVAPLVETAPLLVRLASDRVPAVRSRALAVLAKKFPDEAQPLLERAVLDRSAAVRELARYLLGARDYAAMYRDLVERGTTPALAGLGETGKASDADVAARFLDHPAPGVRRAAVKCVMRLDPDAFTDRVTAMLADPSPGVSAAARDVLRNRSLDHTALVGIYTSAAAPNVRRNAVSLFARLPKWQSITALLVACTDPDAEVAAHAHRFIRETAATTAARRRPRRASSNSSRPPSRSWSPSSTRSRPGNCASRSARYNFRAEARRSTGTTRRPEPRRRRRISKLDGRRISRCFAPPRGCEESRRRVEDRQSCLSVLATTSGSRSARRGDRQDCLSSTSSAGFFTASQDD